MTQIISVISSCITSTVGGWRGTDSFRPAKKQPEKLLTLYEFEGCPFCRRVRNVLTALDLDALILPSPKNGTRFRPTAVELSGKSQFPFLIDENTGTQLLESADIIEYLYATYGERAVPMAVSSGLDSVLSNIASATRPVHGMRAQPSKKPEQPLQLFSFESSPFSRLVREKLCELELPYILRNTGKARWEDMGPPSMRNRFFPDLPISGRNRKLLESIAGKVQLPYLIDDNTGVSMFESADIVAYLQATYGQ